MEPFPCRVQERCPPRPRPPAAASAAAAAPLAAAAACGGSATPSGFLLPCAKGATAPMRQRLQQAGAEADADTCGAENLLRKQAHLPAVVSVQRAGAVVCPACNSCRENSNVRASRRDRRGRRTPASPASIPSCSGAQACICAQALGCLSNRSQVSEQSTYRQSKPWLLTLDSTFPTLCRLQVSVLILPLGLSLLGTGGVCGGASDGGGALPNHASADVAPAASLAAITFCCLLLAAGI